jgi:hypothetical protein
LQWLIVWLSGLVGFIVGRSVMCLFIFNGRDSRNMDIQNNATEIAVKVASNISYSISGGLVVLDVLKFMNEYAAAFGVILGIMTFILNLIFQVVNHHTIKKAIKGDNQ